MQLRSRDFLNYIQFYSSIHLLEDSPNRVFFLSVEGSPNRVRI